MVLWVLTTKYLLKIAHDSTMAIVFFFVVHFNPLRTPAVQQRFFQEILDLVPRPGGERKDLCFPPPLLPSGKNIF